MTTTMNPELTESQAYSIDEFYHLLHDTINGYLEGKIALDDEKDKSILQIIRDIDSIFASEHHYSWIKWPLELYVGVDDTIENLDKYVGEQRVYTIATLDDGFAEEYAKNSNSFILRLSIQTDEVPFFCLDTHSMSEVLINRGVVFDLANIYLAGHELNPTKRTLVDCIVTCK